jgi:hypothetical protein
LSVAGNMPDHYKFNGDITTGNAQLLGNDLNNARQLYEEVPSTLNEKNSRDYPCQRLFNNSTKRSTLPNFQNTFDINPKFLS